MTSPGHADNPEARLLREAIGADLRALRQMFGRKVSPSTTPAGDIPEQMGRMLRANPAWAAAAAAGALAGLWVAVRNRLRREQRSTQ